MKSITTTALLLAMATTTWAAVRVNLRLGVGHPIRRPARTVVVRPIRPAVVVAPKVVYAAPVVWTRNVVALPPRERIVVEDSETFHRSEDWVDTTLAVNQNGDKMFVRVNGRVQVDFAEVHFRGGQVQVVDFGEAPLEAGTYSLLDFKDGRHVDYVRLVARARSQNARVSVLLAR